MTAIEIIEQAQTEIVLIARMCETKPPGFAEVRRQAIKRVSELLRDALGMMAATEPATLDPVRVAKYGKPATGGRLPPFTLPAVARDGDRGR